jgi:hypothetical protein
MDLRYRVEFVCPDCEAEFQITCPANTELCTCGAVLVEALSFEHN